MQKEQEVKICSRCVCDTTIPGIIFDEQGICNFCKIFNKMEKEYPTGRAAEEKLNKIVNQIKRDGLGKKYDCIVGVSGGRDSTYLLYLAKELGLRPLAVHFDNGWDSEISVTNIKNALDILKIDLVTLVVNWEEFKNLQISFLKASVRDVEVPNDVGILGALHKIAYQEKIKYILNGHSFRTEGVMPLTWNYIEGKYLENIQRIFGDMKLKTFPNFKIRELIWYTVINRIKTVPILALVPYNQKKVSELITKELGWCYYGGHHHESYFTKFFQSYYLPKKFNVDKRKIEASALIRSGQINRDQALKEIQAHEYPYEDELIDYIISKLNITRAEFDRIYNLPVKSFKDYPTYYSLINFLHLPFLWAVKLGIVPELLYQKFFPERTE